MKDSQDEIEEVIRSASWIAGYVKGTLTEEEKTDLLAWLEKDDHWNVFERIVNEQYLTDAHALLKQFDAERALAKVKANPAFYQPITVDGSEQTGTRRVIRFVRRRWLTIAASVLVISAALLYVNREWIQETANRNPHEAYAVPDIMPGKQGATLTLGSGEKINLNDVEAGEVVSEAGMTVRKTADGNLIYTVSQDVPENSGRLSANTLSTDKGETYRVVLPDGSVVDLNAASQLTYPASFSKLKERKVTLMGEGYFQVAKDSQRPFVVETAGQQVLVLGTEFNIKAYPDEDKIITTLVAGSLKVIADGIGHIVLAPSEETVFNGAALGKETADMAASIAWRQGRFHFNKTPFDTMIRELARWYNVDVEYTDKTTPNIRFSGEMRRDVSLKTVLSYLDDLGVSFRMEERKLIIE